MRGLHLPEKHVGWTGGERIPGCLFDFGSVFLPQLSRRVAPQAPASTTTCRRFRATKRRRGGTRCSHTPKQRFNVPVGTIKATFLIETLPAAFQMHEILYALRDHAVALNCGRWDYIFSYIKTLRKHADRVLPDRQALTMDKPFLSAYSRLLIRTCHRRGALAMGGMAAFIPSKDPQARTKSSQPKSAPTKHSKRRTVTTALGLRIRDSPISQWKFSTGTFRKVTPINWTSRAPGSATRRPPICWRFPPASAPKQACAPTSACRSSTSKRGSPAAVACRFTA